MGKRQSGVMGERIQEIMHQARREYRRIWRFRWKAPDLSVCLGTNQAQLGKKFVVVFCPLSCSSQGRGAFKKPSGFDKRMEK